MAIQQISIYQISANSSSNGQVLASNGTSLYWATGGNGYTGSAGATGYTGSSGTGFTGSTGSTGYTGSKGDTGYTGSQGPAGTFGGAAFDYTFNANTDNTDPGNGGLKLSNTNFAQANTLYINENADNFVSVYNYLQTIDDSTSAIKGHFTVTEKANNANFVLYAITGSHTHYTNYFSVPASYLSGSTSFSNGLDVIITFARTGDIGDTGYTGSTGSTGYTGSTGSIGYTGSTGSAGTNGYDGSVGFTGSTGVGYTGSAGSSAVANLDAQYAWTNTHTFSGNVSFTGNNTLFKVPVGTTAQRPANPPTGALRFNTSTTDLEYAANSTTWYSITTQETLTSNNVSVNNAIRIGNTTVNTYITANSFTGFTGTFYGNVFVTGNSAVFKVPVGTTAQRPAVGTGYIRFNTSTTDLEYSDGTTWYSVTTQETLTSNNISVNNAITVGNSTVNSIITSAYVKTGYVNATAFYANGSFGSAGQILTSNGANVYWSSSANNAIYLGGVAANQYVTTVSNYNLTGEIGFTKTTTLGEVTLNNYETTLQTYSTTLDTTPKYINYSPVTALDSTTTGYTVEFFIKFNTLSTTSTKTAITYGSTGSPSIAANTTTIEIANGGYSTRGSAAFTLTTGVWYHIAYIGINSQTYFAVNGVVKSLNNIGGDNAYTPDGSWNNSFKLGNGPITVSNFRIKRRGDVYSLNGFNPPSNVLTADSDTELLTLVGSTFVDSGPQGLTVSTTGSPTLVTDTISDFVPGFFVQRGNISNGVVNAYSFTTNTSYGSSTGGFVANTSAVGVGNSTVNTLITSTYVKTATVNATAIYANGSYGTSGQVLTSNGTNIYWSSAVGYTGSDGAIGYTGSSGSIGYTGSSGTGGGGGASVTVSATAPVSPSNGDMWWNTDNGTLYLYYSDGDSSQWVSAIPTTAGTIGPIGYTGSAGTGSSGGAVGGGTDKIFYENDISITADYTITANKNAMTAGPITIANGVTVTVLANTTWTIV